MQEAGRGDNPVQIALLSFRQRKSLRMMKMEQDVRDGFRHHSDG
jgi:hypothetical protein